MQVIIAKKVQSLKGWAKRRSSSEEKNRKEQKRCLPKHSNVQSLLSMRNKAERKFVPFDKWRAVGRAFSLEERRERGKGDEKK
jgi:hypothetical protein